MSPEISVVLCTWNRASLLGDALDALLRQDAAPPHEIVVVDNGSTDETRLVVEQRSAGGNLRYVLETNRGLSYARNTGIAATSAPIIAFTDDDIRVERDWLRSLRSAFIRHPDAACAGGPVTPVWPNSAVPLWLTERQWAPLGVQNYGPHELRVDASTPICLIGANLAVRRDALVALGGFAAGVQRIGDGAGSTEDHEFHLRLWKSGRFGVYDPAVRARGVITPRRIEKSHHRRWHFGHGRHVARMRLPEIEQSRLRLFGAPVHLLRQAGRDVREWVALTLERDPVAAFEREARLWFAAGFLRERWG